MIKENISHIKLAEQFDVTPSTISSIKRGKNWAWLNVSEAV